jgi:hypothetical protein
MRPPVVKRPTIPTRGYVLVFRLLGSWRCRRPVSWPDVISVHWRRPHVSAPHPERGSVALGMARTAGVELSSAAEQPIGARVPSSARRRLNGERAPVRPRCGCGAAHGHRARRPPHVRSRSARPLHAPGSGLYSRQAHTRSLAPWRRAGRAWVPGCSRPWPVRRQARPLRSARR